HIGAREPAVEIDIGAALRAERKIFLHGRLAADRTGLFGHEARAHRASADVTDVTSLDGRGEYECLDLITPRSASRNGSDSPRRKAARWSRKAAGRRHWCRSRPA